MSDEPVVDSGTVEPQSTETADEALSAPADAPMAPSGAPARTPGRIVRALVDHHQALLILTLCVILAIGVRIDRVLLNTFPTGGDNGGHLGMPAYVRRVLAPQWRLTGWTNDWFAGVPILGLYFPFPTWLIVGLNTLLPYSVAYKIVTILGTIGLPWATWRLGKKAGLADPGPLYLGMAAVPFLLNRSYRILGGNILSTMAGEFSFSLSLLLCVLYFGSLLDVLRHDRHRARAALLLAMTGLSHVVPSMVAAVGTAAFLLAYAERARLRRQLTNTFVVGGVGLLLSGFWLVPFASLLPYANSMDYERNTLFLRSLFPFLHGKHTPFVLPDGGALIIGAMLLSVVALVWGAGRRQRFVLALTIIGASAAVGFMVWPTGSMWNNRLIPIWFFVLFLLGGLGGAAIVRRLTTSPFAPGIVGVAALFIALAPTFDALPGWFPLPIRTANGWELKELRKNKDYSSADLPFAWAATNAEGMQRKKAWPEYQALITELKKLPCGRLFWEQDKGYVRFGSTMALMSIPYFTKSCIQSVEGLYFESTQTTPFSFLTSSLVSNAPSNPQRDLKYPGFNLDTGVDRLRRLGARYLLASSDRLKAAARTRADLRELATSGTFTIYEVMDHAVVAPLDRLPVVVRNAKAGLGGGFLDLGLAQWADTATFPDTYVVDGLPSWPQADLIVRRTRVPGKLRDTRGTGVTVVSATTAAVQSSKRPVLPTATTAPATVLATPAANPTNVAGPVAVAPTSSTAPTTPAASSVPPTPPSPSLASIAASGPLPKVVVSNAVVGPMSVDFDVDRVGVPVLVRVSWSPGWRVSGGTRPFRAAPNFFVVVPTERHVRITMGRTKADLAGHALSVIGLVAVVDLALSDRRRRKAARSSAASVLGAGLPTEGEPQGGQPAD